MAQIVITSQGTTELGTEVVTEVVTDVATEVVTEEFTEVVAEGGVPLFGYPGYGFNAVHITAMVSLTISNVTSVCVLLFQCCTSKVPFFR